MTIRLAADENLRRAIVVGLQREVESVDIVRVQGVGLRTADDHAVLEWAAGQGRILITHDIRTIPDFAYQRVTAGEPMAGVFIIGSTLPVAFAIKELATVVLASEASDWANRIVYLPALSQSGPDLPLVSLWPIERAWTPGSMTADGCTDGDSREHNLRFRHQTTAFAAIGRIQRHRLRWRTTSRRSCSTGRRSAMDGSACAKRVLRCPATARQTCLALEQRPDSARESRHGLPRRQ